MPNENNSLRNSLARYLLGRDFLAFGTVFAGGMCCKSLRHKDLRQPGRAAFSISLYAVRVYVNPLIRGVNVCLGRIQDRLQYNTPLYLLLIQLTY